MEFVKLDNGVLMPVIGFGTYKATDFYGQQVLEEALACGYRSFDTATLYRNEGALGHAIAASGFPRTSLFLSSKVPQNDLGYDQAKYYFDQTLSALQTDYLDLYMIHWPMEDRSSLSWQQKDLETWRALEELYDQGSVRAIGVCNFLPHHLMNLFSSANEKPMVNQIEFHPGYTQQYLVNFCRQHGILLEAWSPIGRGKMHQIPVLQQMAKKYGKTVAQLCIRFAIQTGLVPLPKSSHPQRMRENLNVFDFTISEEDMSRLSTLPQCGWSGKHADFTRWAPELQSSAGDHPSLLDAL